MANILLLYFLSFWVDGGVFLKGNDIMGREMIWLINADKFEKVWSLVLLCYRLLGLTYFYGVFASLFCSI